MNERIRGLNEEWGTVRSIRRREFAGDFGSEGLNPRRSGSSGRLEDEAGLLLIGDTAHPMSLIRAQGIKVMIRDATVESNHLLRVSRKAVGEDGGRSRSGGDSGRAGTRNYSIAEVTAPGGQRTGGHLNGRLDLLSCAISGAETERVSLGPAELNGTEEELALRSEARAHRGVVF